jgi:hypothetical protein
MSNPKKSLAKSQSDETESHTPAAQNIPSLVSSYPPGKFYRLKKLNQYEYSIEMVENGIVSTVGVPNLLSIVTGKLAEMMWQDCSNAK